MKTNFIQKKNHSVAVTLALCFLLFSPTATYSGEMQAFDGAANDCFGFPNSISGSTALVGAPPKTVSGNPRQGAAYVFRNLHTATGTITENVKLISSDGAPLDEFGSGVALFGTIGVVAARLHDVGSNIDQGAAYVFRNLNTATGTITQDAKLVASDGGLGDGLGQNYIGISGVSGTTALLGAPGHNTYQGAAYVFRNLDTVTGTVNQNAKLVASDGAANDYFGISVSLSGTIGLVGAHLDDIGLNDDQGSAYVFRNLDTATGTITENAKLVASDGASNDYFGDGVSISGSIGLVGAYAHDVGSNSNQGAAYVFRNLDTVTGTVNEVAKLLASDGATDDRFGGFNSISGNIGIIGALSDIGTNTNQGAVYVFRNLDTVTGTAFESVKLYASNGAANDFFGISSLDGDRFVVGAFYRDIGSNSDQGNAYFGHVRTFTTADLGNDSTATDGLSFQARDNWIIGQSTSNNSVTLTSGDSGNVGRVGLVNPTSAQTYIGQNAGSSDNTLNVDGSLISNTVVVGASGDGNTLVVSGSVNIASGQQLIVGENAGAINNAVSVATGGIINNSSSGSVTSVGRNGGQNTMIVNGTVNSGLTYVGENSSSNALAIGSTGTLNVLGGQRLVVGQSATSNNNFVIVSSGGLLNASAFGSILSVGRNGDDNTMTVNGTVSSRVTHVGENAGSDNNVMAINASGVFNSLGNANVGAVGNSGNELRANGTINLSSGTVLNVFTNNVLTGSGTIQGTGSNVVISGSLRPGSGAGGSGIGTLTRNDGDVTWNGNASSPWVFELGIAQATMALANTGGTRDLLNITAGDFLKGTGSSFVFDFAGTGSPGWYKLVDWSGTTNFVAGDFTATNLNSLVLFSQFVVDVPTSALYIELIPIPEPRAWALLSAMLLALVSLRLRLRKAAGAQSTTVV